MKTVLNHATRCFCLTLLTLLGSALQGAASSTETGWQQLTQNQSLAAGASFTAAVKQNPSDTDALRGLALVNWQENNEAGAVKAWAAFYRLAPGHWASQAYWPLFAKAAEDTGRWDILRSAAQEILASKTALPALKASAHFVLAQSADRMGASAEAGREWDALGYLKSWQVIGPFDNASLSGFDKTYSPEQEVDFAKTSYGKDDHALRWHRLALMGRDGVCAVGKSLGDEESNVFYAAAIVTEAHNQRVSLQFDPTGASKIYINGVLAFSDSLYRAKQEFIVDPYPIPVTLQAGRNTILIKLADDENSTADFRLRLTPQSSPALAPRSIETTTITLLRSLPRSLETSALLGEHLRLAHDYAASEELLHAALVTWPESGWLHWQLAQTLDNDGQLDDSKAERSVALKDNPRLLLAALAAIADEADALSAPERLTRLRAALAQSPTSPETFWALSSAYDEAKLTDEAIHAAQQAESHAPGDASLLRLVKLYQDESRNTAAAALLTQALRAAPDDIALLAARGEMLSDQENDVAAVALYQRLLVLDPSNTATRVSLTDLYKETSQPKLAILNLRFARNQQPQSAELCASLADLLRESGQTKEALELYQAAIALNPAELTLREKVAVLSGQKPVLDLAPAIAGDPILAGAFRSVDPPGASAVMLLDEGRTVIYPDYASLTRFHQIIKVLDLAAVRRFQNYPLSRTSSTDTATVENARLYQADGKVQDVTADAQRGSVAFPALVLGDVIDIMYRVERYQRGGLAHQYWSEWGFNEVDIPSKLSRFVLITPPGITFQTQNHGAVPPPTVKNISGWRIQEWRGLDIPARKAEVFGVGYTDAALWLDISTISSWATIVQWYQDLSSPRCLPDAAIRAKAIALTSEAKTEQDKIRALAAYVARDIQYQSSPFRMSAYVPTEGKQVMRERYGDCKDKAALLTALLAVVGIKSDMVLLSPRNYGLTPYLPSPRFNHAIALVHTSQGPQWIDATADQMEFGGLPYDDQQVPALIINPATTGLTQTPTLAANRDRFEDAYTGTLSEDGKLNGAFAWTLFGNIAWEMRSVWREQAQGKQEELLRGMAAYLVKDASFESGSVDHLSEPDKPFLLHFQYHVDHDGTTAGNFLLLPLPWNGQAKEKAIERLLADPARTEDMEVASSRSETESSLRLTLPAGYVPQDLPPLVQSDTPYGSYQFTYRMDGSVLQATREIKMLPLRIPAADAARYIAFLQGLDHETQRQIVLKRQ